ncbi:uncharacterized protein LOC103950132 isoform X2 [Pyrus x bretschneideri]|uniref:uncharacterized protein LOC103950132 isoform X2 n=1 Tax=Pyrus x bretschneideri TaxID=225117 RepID=UPI00202DDE31|nr:uncharacterized protein LOC103950132 isoform X2 [Pyrus x bretschneideri]
MAAAIHCSSALHSLKPPPLPPQLSSLRPSLLSANKHPNRRKNNNLSGYRLCRAEFSNDAPFAAAIGACMLSSLVLPVSTPDDDDSGGSPMDSTDARFAVMGIVSFIPYFNWLSWIFAWLDTGKRRYAVYALVYLVPYLRTNLSLSPEESWLPVASIVFCIIHVQNGNEVYCQASWKQVLKMEIFRAFNSLRRLQSISRQRLEGKIIRVGIKEPLRRGRTGRITTFHPVKNNRETGLMTGDFPRGPYKIMRAPMKIGKKMKGGNIRRSELDASNFYLKTQPLHPDKEKDSIALS